MLDRQMSTLMGLPQAIRDDDVSTPLPHFNNPRESIGLELHVRLSRVVADIVNTVYSTEGRLPRKFLASTKQALQNIARVTEMLGSHIEMPKDLSKGGISRFGAYLHLLNHQCICLTTRPIVFSFLDRRLQSRTGCVDRVVPRGSAQVLLRMCIDSAQQMLHILTALKDEGCLESFLPFDLEAVFIAAMVLVMARTIDVQLLEDHTLWTHMAYSILDDMAARGNLIASVRKRELRHLTEVLSHAETPAPSLNHQNFDESEFEGNRSQHPMDFETNMIHQPFDDPFWQDEMTADQLREIADSLDLDGLDWITTSVDGAST